MIGPKTLDELSRRVHRALPEGVDRLEGDVRRNIRAALESALSRMDLVSREEFDVQMAVLRRSREKIDALEAQVRRLEQALAEHDKKDTSSTDRRG